jgi:hypothetical protein
MEGDILNKCFQKMKRNENREIPYNLQPKYPRNQKHILKHHVPDLISLFQNLST